MLDRQPFNGIGIITAPDLGIVAQHSGIKASAAACAALEQNLREALRQPLCQRINAQHIAVHDLTLLLGRESTAVHIAHAAVHIPLDILNVMLPQQLAK